MLKRFSEGAPPLDLIEEREAIFRLLPSTTPERLQKKTAAYTIDPHTRYPNLNTLVPTTDVYHLYDSDTVPKVPVIETKKDTDVIIKEAAGKKNTDIIIKESAGIISGQFLQFLSMYLLLVSMI